MGQNASVGNRAGKLLYTFTAAGQDSGPLLFNEASGYSKWLLQALVGAGGSGAAITVYSTIDLATAQGTASNWFQVPMPATESGPAWANPMTDINPAFYAGYDLLCVRLVSALANPPTPWVGSVSVLAYVKN